eukprot:1880448-Amphidinium_carterae.1
MEEVPTQTGARMAPRMSGAKIRSNNLHQHLVRFKLFQHISKVQTSQWTASKSGYEVNRAKFQI